jgi:hypothetical protein
MSMRSALPLLALTAALGAASPASATTFCVPAFTAACPNSAGNVQQADLQTAMQTNGDDGVADRVVIAAGTFSRPDSLEVDSGDGDALEVVGAGRGVTYLTSTQNSNAFIVDLDGGRAVTMRDLTIQIPASFPDSAGSGLQARKATLERVDIESRNPGSDGASMVGGGTIRDGKIYGAAGGSIDDGIGTNGAVGGVLEVERTTIDHPSWGLVVDDPGVPVVARRVRIVTPSAYGMRIADGASAILENSIVHVTGTAQAVLAVTETAASTLVSLRHVTIVGLGMDINTPAIRVIVPNSPGSGSVSVVVKDSILAGFETPLWREAPTGPNTGDANLLLSYSHLRFGAYDVGDGSTSLDATNIDAWTSNPMFTSIFDYHLKPGSPAIDSGDPEVASITAEDYDGHARPMDGDGNGAARRDMGAFEYQPPAAPPVEQPPATDPGTNPPAGDPPSGDPIMPGPGAAPALDMTKPRISGLRFRRLGARRGAVVSMTLSEAATVVLRLRPLGHARAAGKAVTLTFKARAGSNRLRIKARRLRARRYRVTVVARDAAGNSSAALVRRITVRR